MAEPLQVVTIAPLIDTKAGQGSISSRRNSTRKRSKSNNEKRRRRRGSSVSTKSKKRPQYDRSSSLEEAQKLLYQQMQNDELFNDDDHKNRKDDVDDDDEDDDDDTLFTAALHERSPISVADVRQYATTTPRRRKVTFAVEPPRHTLSCTPAQEVQQRLQGLTLAELECGLSVPKSAHRGGKPDPPVPPPHKAQIMCKKMRKKPQRPIPVLEQRLERVKRQLVESQFDLDVDCAEVDDLRAENKYLRKKLRRAAGDDTEQALNETLEELAYKKRKYEKKIRTLRKAKEANEGECYSIVRQILEQPDMREQLTDAQISILENIDAANRKLTKDKKRQSSNGTKKKRRSKSSGPTFK